MLSFVFPKPEIKNLSVEQGKIVGLFAGLIVVHGILNCLATKWLAKLTKGFVFVNLGATFGKHCHETAFSKQRNSSRQHSVMIVVLLAKTPRSEMHPASYVFGSAGIVNQTGGWNTGIAFLFGLLSVQWTVCRRR
jgi:hypothetical protein